MKNVYIVEWTDGIDMDGICCICSTRELAEHVIDGCLAWKKDFREKFGKSYDDLHDNYGLKDEHMDWLWDRGVEYNNQYYIIESMLYDENDTKPIEQKIKDYTYSNIPED